MSLVGMDEGQWLSVAKWIVVCGYEMMEVRGEYLGMDDDQCWMVSNGWR